MYVPPAFKVEDGEAAEAFAAAHPFSTLTICGADGPVIAYAPLVAERDTTGALVAFKGHLAKANPFWRLAGPEGANAVAVFRGSDAYVSPSNYPSKAEHGRVVPTWNYLAAEARGRLSVETDLHAILNDYLPALTDQMEADRNAPWRVSDAPEAFTAKLASAIVGVRLVVTEFTAKRKLDQTKALQDFRAVQTAFRESDDPDERALAEEMDKEERR